MFMAEVVRESSLREAAARVGLGHEALRKFLHGITRRPHDRGRQGMAELCLEHRRRLADSGSTPTAGHLKLVFPRGLDPALAEVQALFDPLRGGPRASTAAELEAWLVRKLREEYAAEPQWGKRKPRKK